MFLASATGTLVPISGTDPRLGPWEHVAFVPYPLPIMTPSLTASTFNAVGNARAALAALDSSAKRLPNPALLRGSAVRREAQSTSALEGTYAPLEDVLAAEAEELERTSANVKEVVNYVRVATHAFEWIGDGRPLTVGLLIDLQRRLVQGTPADNPHAGRLRDIQVVVGSQPGLRVQDARYIPRPPGSDLDAQVRDLLDWMDAGHPDLDPVVSAGMAHYQFETLHPFNDGNGRIGRLLVVLQLMASGVLTEPSLTVSPWFEARRRDYYDALLAVSTRGDWDTWLSFFARGIEAAAKDTERQLGDLLKVQADLKTRIRQSPLRADTALLLVDYALEQPIFTARMVERRLKIAYPRANGLIQQLVNLGVLRQYGDAVYDRKFTAPDVLAVLLRPSS